MPPGYQSLLYTEMAWDLHPSEIECSSYSTKDDQSIISKNNFSVTSVSCSHKHAVLGLNGVPSEILTYFTTSTKTKLYKKEANTWQTWVHPPCTHTHTHTHTCTHTSISELHHHWAEQNMLSAILPSSQVSGIQNGTGKTPIYTSVLSSVQLEICDGYQMRTTVGS